MLPWSGRTLHFVGIGGAGMSGLALVAHALGATVTVSDRAAGSPYAGPLLAAGIAPVAGHAAANVPPGAELVVSSAIPPDNPERAVARERGQRELHRAALLGELTRLRPTIAITGTHGKTTTSSMVVHALRGCGLDPGYLVGGAVRSTGANAGWGTGVARGRGGRVRPLAARRSRPGSRSSPTPSSTTTRPTPRGATSTTPSGPSSRCRPRRCSRRSGLAEVALGSALLASALCRRRHADPEPTAGGSRFSMLDGVAVGLKPGTHNARATSGCCVMAARLAGATSLRAAAAAALQR